jgi:hypothetical protein
VATNRSRNLTFPKAPFLPDAPDAVPVTVGGESPYHESSASAEEHFRSLWGIHLMAIACVRDVRPSVEGELDFSPASLGLIDKVIDRRDIEKDTKEDAIVFVAELGSYFGVVLQMEHGGEWHTSPAYYFSALRFKTKSRGIIETNPFVAVVKRAYGKQNEALLSAKYAILSRMIGS